MKLIRILTIFVVALMAATELSAQDSVNSGVRRRDGSDRRDGSGTPGVSGRMQQFYDSDDTYLSEGDVQWMRVIYRELDLDKPQNSPLYFPEEPVDGEENFFRIIMRLLTSGQLKAYEYLDGREIFTDQYEVNVGDMLDRFHIYHTEAKGSTEKSRKYVVEDVDLPSNEVLSYYIVERWTFDNRNNRVRTQVEAICPVLHRSGDFGGQAVKYPMFWVKYNDLRPSLSQQAIFLSDDNNLPTCSYDDYFNLALYDGDIYKTRNLRNRSMMQLYPDPEDMRRAQDSIDNVLAHFEDKLWVPDREDVIAAREAREAALAEGGDSLGNVVMAPVPDDPSDKRTVRSNSRGKNKGQSKAPKAKEKKPKADAGGSSSGGGAVRSVRRKK